MECICEKKIYSEDHRNCKYSCLFIETSRARTFYVFASSTVFANYKQTQQKKYWVACRREGICKKQHINMQFAKRYTHQKEQYNQQQHLSLETCSYAYRGYISYEYTHYIQGRISEVSAVYHILRTTPYFISEAKMLTPVQSLEQLFILDSPSSSAFNIFKYHA